MDYAAVMNKIIVAMITANQRQWTVQSMKDLCRMIAPHATEDELDNLMKEVKTDDRIKKTRVTSRKIYFSYRGLTE